MRLFAGTEFDRPPRCEQCGELEEVCECPPEPKKQIAPEKQTLRIGVEKRKKGKLVTVIRDLADENDHTQLFTDLKNSCGAGGAIKGDTIEIQGDHHERLLNLLTNRGYKIRKKQS